MFALVVAVLAAAPVNVIAVHGPQSETALARLSAQPNVTIVDASALHEYLLRPSGMLPMQDFESFTAAPFISVVAFMYRTVVCACLVQ